MAFTEEQLEQIDAALASPEAEVQIKDRRVRFKSNKELLDARAAVSAEVNQAGVLKPVRQYLPYTKSGLD